METKHMGIHELLKLLTNGHIIGLPLNNFEVLNLVKEEAYRTLGPLSVGINFKRNLFIVQHDPHLHEKLYY